MSRHRSNSFTARGRSNRITNVLLGIIAVCTIVIMLSIEGVVSLAIGGVAVLVILIIAIGVLIASVTNR